MYPLGLGSENLFMPLLLAAILLLLIAWQHSRLRYFLASGLILGAATLTRPALVFFLPLAGLWIWRHSGLRSATAATLAAIAVLIPWSVRNSLVLGRPAFIENTLGYNLFVGYHPDGNGGYVNEVGVIPTRFLDDSERDRWTMQQALGFIRADPGRALGLMARRTVYFWGLEDREMIYFYANDFFGPIPSAWLVAGYLALITPLVLIGLSAPWGMALARYSSVRSLILALIASALIAYIPILAEPRFHLPLMPFLAIFAAGFWADPHSLDDIRNRLASGRLGAWLAMVTCVALLVIWAIYLWGSFPRLSAILAPGGNRLWLNY
jgi:4-amino-4-deoxy-L-arabinose transferase-like glycosyltransferase